MIVFETHSHDKKTYNLIETGGYPYRPEWLKFFYKRYPYDDGKEIRNSRDLKTIFPDTKISVILREFDYTIREFVLLLL